MLPRGGERVFLLVDASASLRRPVSQALYSSIIQTTPPTEDIGPTPHNIVGTLPPRHEGVCGALALLLHHLAMPPPVTPTVGAAPDIPDVAPTSRSGGTRPLVRAAFVSRRVLQLFPAFMDVGVARADIGRRDGGRSVVEESLSTFSRSICRRYRRETLRDAPDFKQALQVAFADETTTSIVIIGDSQPLGSTSDLIRTARRWNARRALPIHCIGFVPPNASAGAERFMIGIAAATGGLYRGVINGTEGAGR